MCCCVRESHPESLETLPAVGEHLLIPQAGPWGAAQNGCDIKVMWLLTWGAAEQQTG
jgi:hypothetical protein